MRLIRQFVEFNRKCSNKLASIFPRFFQGRPYKDLLLDRIYENVNEGTVKRILEVGGIDRPLLAKSIDYQYDGLDIDLKERCHELYDEFYVQSIEDEIAGKYDSIISFTLFEHVPDNNSSFKNIYVSLNKGGETHHYIPSKWHLYSMALRLVGPNVQKRLIPILRPGAEKVSGYPAYFHHCSIPSIKKLFTKIGFEKIHVIAFYRANDYFSFFFPFFLIVSAFENICRMLNFKLFASGFIISAKKSSK